MAKKIPESNNASLADIAFMLLIFFLVTTTMSVDSGLLRQLPQPPPDNIIPPKVNERNVFVVLVNKNNQLFVESKVVKVNELCALTKEFILNPLNKDNLSEGVLLSAKLADPDKSAEHPMLLELQKMFGDVRVSKGLVSLKNDRGTAYGTYIEVQNELVRAFNEIKNDMAMQAFQKPYNDLGEEMQKAIRAVIPQKISEAEPENIK